MKTIRPFIMAMFSLIAVPLAAVAEDSKTVAITYIVEHPALDAARQGIIDGLAEDGFTEGKNLKLIMQSAQGSMPTQMQIAKDFAGQKPDLMVGISTPSAQALQSVAGKTPVVFSAVTDPVDAKLVASLEKPGGTITGTSDRQHTAPTFDLIAKLVPDTKTIGVLYNAGEANSVSTLAEFKAEAEKRGLKIAEATVSQSAMVGDAARSLVGRADVILIPTDSTVVSALESAITVGQKAKLPVIASDTDSVERGAVAALGFDHHRLGVITGKIAARILKGEKPADIPVETLESRQLYLNKAAAKAMGVKVPENMLKSATKLVE